MLTLEALYEDIETAIVAGEQEYASETFREHYRDSDFDKQELINMHQYFLGEYGVSL